MIKIGVATDASKETSSSFGEVDLLDEEVGGKTENKPEPKKESPKDDGNDGGSSSSSSNSDSDSSSDSSDSDGSDSDSDLSEGSPSSGSDESTSSSSAGGAKTAVTQKHRNFMTPLKRAVKSSGGSNSERKMPVGTSVPPPATFKHTKRFSVKNPMVPKRGGGGKHQRLATDEGEAEAKERHSNDPGREFKVHDPANFPLEQFTDAEYGKSGSPPDNYSYASADPNNFDYEPHPLVKMDAVDTRAHEQKWQRKIIAYGFCCTIIVCLFIMIATIVAFHNHMNVRPAPNNLAEVCSMQSIGTEMGHKRCQKSCKEAACCMASHDSSCFLEQLEVCMEVCTLKLDFFQPHPRMIRCAGLSDAFFYYSTRHVELFIQITTIVQAISIWSFHQHRLILKQYVQTQMSRLKQVSWIVKHHVILGFVVFLLPCLIQLIMCLTSRHAGQPMKMFVSIILPVRHWKGRAKIMDHRWILQTSNVPCTTSSLPKVSKIAEIFVRRGAVALQTQRK